MRKRVGCIQASGIGDPEMWVQGPPSGPGETPAAVDAGALGGGDWRFYLTTAKNSCHLSVCSSPVSTFLSSAAGVYFFPPAFIFLPIKVEDER